MNKYYCKQAMIGLQFSHPQRGHALCCASFDRYYQSPKELWNSEVIQKKRDKILAGKPISDCHGCYQNEYNNIKSFREIYNDQFKNYKDSELPQHMDLDLSNLCNLKCVMCGPDRSSMWAKEKNLFKESKGVTNIKQEWLDEICELSHDIKYLTIQGGEPTLIDEYIYFFEYLKKHNIIKNVGLNVVTNLTNVSTKFFSFVPDFANVSISVSIDAFGSANNYIRYPSNFDKVTENLKSLTKFDNVYVSVNSAVQTLSMFDVKGFIEWTNSIKNHFESQNKNLDNYFQHVITPKELSIFNAPRRLKDKFLNDLDKAKCNIDWFNDLAVPLGRDNKFNSKLTSKYINNIDTGRNIDVTDYVPDFYDYFIRV